MAHKIKNALVVCISTFPPRECGIATFSQDLLTAYNHLFLPHTVEMKVVSMQAPEDTFKYSKDVLFTIQRDVLQSYANAAQKLNKNIHVELISIQHEFGIFGGVHGKYLEEFLAHIAKPVVVTLHTVLPNPEPDIIARITNINKRADGFVVMTELSKRILITDYAVAEEKITVIAHGIHPQLYIEKTDTAKMALHLPKSLALSTFGLLSRNKGIEYVIRSLPAVVKKFPGVQYNIIGKTHPSVQKYEGESYRSELQSLVRSLGLEKNVNFINTYFNTEKLLEYLQATDVYISGSLDPNQAVSGTLSYALGAGRPVISTNFAQAREAITSDVGLVVPFRKPSAYSKAILHLLKSDTAREQMGKNAYFKTRHMAWPNVGLAYAKYFCQFSPYLIQHYRNLPPIKLDHIQALTDDFGIFQFAHLHIPDTQYGYTLDDNARALLAMVYYYKKFRDQQILPYISIYLNFIQTASKGNGTFHNYFNAAHELDMASDERDSMADANARCLYALMTVAGSSFLPKEMRACAKQLYAPALMLDCNSLRASAFFVKGLYALKNQSFAIAAIEKHCNFLLKEYKNYASPDWAWFESKLTYSNALLPEALLLGYLATGKRKYLTVGKKTLNFLMSHTFFNGMYVGIGQDGWFERGGSKALFDQQPEDSAAMVHALKTVYGINKEKKYEQQMHEAFNWFLGDNVLHQFVYDPISGGSHDGLSERHTNLNQGAESSLSYLLSRLLF